MTTDTSNGASDIRVDSLFMTLVPARWRPYALLARLDRPIPIWFLLLPCWWSLALAGATNPLLYLAFGVGAIVMRGAGCTLNDMIDRDIDRKVARTATRPIAAGLISRRQAAAFLLLQLIIAANIAFALGRPALIICVASLILVATYPLMKRITWWPQFFLGLAFNIGALVGWVAAGRELGVAPVMLYAAGILWTLGYDTIYALQDIDDDAVIGVKSTARLFGTRVRGWVAGFYLGAAALLAVILALGSQGWAAWAGLGAAAAQLGWQVWKLAPAGRAESGILFRSNRYAGWLFLAGLLVDSLLRLAA